MELLKLRRATFVNGKHPYYCRRNPADLKWNEVDVDVVAECTGFFTTVETNDTSKVVLKSYYFCCFC
jgi:glyceraldehyde-3-phosphate dehydrogenase/erythrose-4-phosphate dehydrogenase